MSKRKKPKFDDSQQETIWNILNTISNHATKSEKTSWNRKRRNIEGFVDEIRPYEEKMLLLQKEMEPLYDKISKLRKDMVDSCIHPFDLLIYKDDHIECKFCETKLSLPKVSGP